MIAIETTILSSRSLPLMATPGIVSEGKKREIFHLARTCEKLFMKYVDSNLPISEPQARAELQQQRFVVWASYLGVFAPPSASLDKRLEYSGEIQNLVVQLLSLMQSNLEFSMFRWSIKAIDC